MLRLKTQTKKYKKVNKLITKALIATIYCCAMVLLTLNKMKYYKTGSYSNYFKSYDEAKCFLETKKKIKIKQLEESLKREILELEEIYKL